MAIRAATRGSALALWQANHVASLVAEANGSVVEPLVVSTAGDRDKTTPLHQIGGKGVFVKEVQAALLDGRADIAVHSAKDLPAVTPDGLTIVAVPARADARDALVGTALADLAPGMVVGTGSIRRRVQLQERVPGLDVVELRGNIDTRLAKVGELDAIVMAAAALDRLERTPEVVDRLDAELMLPQVGQGTLAIECRADDADTIAALASIDHAESRLRLTCERAFLEELGGDCDLPAGAFAELADDDVTLSLRSLLADDAGVVHRDDTTGTDPVSLGTESARRLRSAIGS